jgi:lipid-binding SYLF domain-containing protein
MKRLTVLAAAMAASMVTAPFAQAETDQQEAVNDATRVIEHIRNGHEPVAAGARDLLHRARAVLIVPELVKGGFIFGAQGGTGVLVAHTRQGGWGAPAFYNLGAGSFGFQIGVEVSRVVLIVMSDHALEALMKDKVKLGAEAGLAVATIGAGAEASTTANAGADIYVMAESKGLFGGVAIEGGIVAPRSEWNSAYYGHPTSARDILIRSSVANPGAARLDEALNRV